MEGVIYFGSDSENKIKREREKDNDIKKESILKKRKMVMGEMQHEPVRC